MNRFQRIILDKVYLHNTHMCKHVYTNIIHFAGLQRELFYEQDCPILFDLSTIFTFLGV